MRLEDLFNDFNQLSAQDQHTFVVQYRERRQQEFLKAETEKAMKKSRGSSSNSSSSSSSKTKETFVLSEEEKLTMKLLGLTMADIKRLRQVPEINVTAEIEETENETEEDAGKDGTELDPGCFDFTEYDE